MIQAAHFYFPVANSYCKRWFGVYRRTIHHTSIAHTESGAMPGTRHYPIFTRSFIKRASQVCTDSPDRVNCGTLFEQHCGDASRINTGEFIFSQVFYVHDSYIIVRTTLPCIMVYTNTLCKGQLTTKVCGAKLVKV